jgi:hypothetical protein
VNEKSPGKPSGDSDKAESRKAVGLEQRGLRILAEIVAEKYLREIKKQDVRSLNTPEEKNDKSLS